MIIRHTALALARKQFSVEIVNIGIVGSSLPAIHHIGNCCGTHSGRFHVGIRIAGIGIQFPMVGQHILQGNTYIIGMVAHTVPEIGVVFLACHQVAVGNLAIHREIRGGAQCKAFHLFHTAVTHIDERSGRCQITGKTIAGIFIDEAQLVFLAPLMGNNATVELHAVLKVGKLQFERTGVEALIHSARIVPTLAERTRHIQVELVPPEMIALVIEYALEAFLARL